MPHLPDQLHLEIDFHMWLWALEFSCLKTLFEQQEKDCGESIKINFRDEVFLSITYSNTHFKRIHCLSISPGKKLNWKHDCFFFFNSRGHGIIHCLSLRASFRSSLIKWKTCICWWAIELGHWAVCTSNTQLMACAHTWITHTTVIALDLLWGKKELPVNAMGVNLLSYYLLWVFFKFVQMY